MMLSSLSKGIAQLPRYALVSAAEDRKVWTSQVLGNWYMLRKVDRASSDQGGIRTHNEQYPTQWQEGIQRNERRQGKSLTVGRKRRDRRPHGFQTKRGLEAKMERRSWGTIPW